MKQVQPPTTAWRESGDAACAQEDRDPELWFADTAQSQAEAKSICREQCPLRWECLAHALVNVERYGVWGGFTARERALMARNVHGTPQCARRCDPRCDHCERALEAYEARLRGRLFA